MAFQFPYRIHHQHRESEDSEIPHNIIASPNAYNRSWVCVLGGWGALWSRMSKTPWWYPQAVPAFASWVLLSLMSREEPFLSHFNRCTVGPEVNGLSFLFFPFFFSSPKASPVLCFQFPAGEQTHAMEVGRGECGRRRRKEGRKKGGKH